MTPRLPPAPHPDDLPGLDDAVELLERALGYTRMALAGVRPAHLARPTPCVRWDLDDLLWHMDDALDAFTEAASGLVVVRRTTAPDPPVPPGPSGVEARLGRLQTKACHLLGVWSDPVAEPVLVGGGSGPRDGLPLSAAHLVGTAALEITVHGWDVAQATGDARPIPADLAWRLLPIAAVGVDAGDRGRRFAPVVPVHHAAPADRRLLAFLGRSLRAADAA